MNKILLKSTLLKSLVFLSVIGLGQASSLTISDAINVAPGNSLKLEDANSYTVANTITVSGSSDHSSSLTATKPIVIDRNGILQLSGSVTATFEDTLTLDSNYVAGSGILRITSAQSQIPNVIVKGKLALCSSASIETDANTQIDIYKKDGEQRALFDMAIFSLYSRGNISGIIDGHGETFMEYYNLRLSADAGLHPNELPTLDYLVNIVNDPNTEYYEDEDTPETLKADVVNTLRGRIKSFFDTRYNTSTIKNMKIQDYLIDKGTSSVSVFDTNKVKCEMTGGSTVIASDTDTKNVVDRNGLTLIRADGTKVFDFYTAFNTQGENSSIPNTAGNSFVQWVSTMQIPLSNETSNNTDFEFKTNLAPSEEYKNDLYITNGVQNVETVKFTGDNSAFTNKVVLNGTLHNIVFGRQNGYVPIDATNIPNDLSLSIPDGADMVDSNNNITDAPIVREGQKVTFSTGNYNRINFTSSDSTERVYDFDDFNIGTNAMIFIGDNNHQGITLIV